MSSYSTCAVKEVDWNKNSTFWEVRLFAFLLLVRSDDQCDFHVCRYVKISFRIFKMHHFCVPRACLKAGEKAC